MLIAVVVLFPGEDLCGNNGADTVVRSEKFQIEIDASPACCYTTPTAIQFLGQRELLRIGTGGRIGRCLGGHEDLLGCYLDRWRYVAYSYR